MIADDSEMNRSLLAAILEDQYEIIEVSNGAEAVALLSQHRSDFFTSAFGHYDAEDGWV